MTMGTEAEQVLQRRIEALMTDYVHTIDADQLEDWPDYFTGAGRYRIVTRENHERGLPANIIYCDGKGMLRDRISAMRKANVFDPQTYCHMTGAIKLEGGDAGETLVQSNFTVIRTMNDGAMSVFACGRYLDRITEQDGALKFAERIAVIDSRRIDTLLVIPL
jgi:anthranilate 1,2-dioxygenase small subunit